MAHLPGRRRPRPRPCRGGFTLIELIVVMAIVALLASIAAPRYLRSVDQARENSLRSSLAVMRQAIDQFAADRGRYPVSLQELVGQRYLRQLPEDPLTGRRDSWVSLAPPPDDVLGASFGSTAAPPGVAGAASGQADTAAAGVWDVRSGAAGRARSGELYADW
ncbi:type II secretion system protein [Aquabacterium sp. OR-4]|uniref:type II secretion system protein n=1 Tax=Aquabacterium sp. OR-4 TaxID=2978127 RepID=UPI0028C9F611|nr:prepilin-type N-terminal cleavage/methylation domain-containing protein [Aquabacterium sp. OR-4]MDT7838945.1 prepilin-type N-terminal cleavage/methylation domain-containing protein [Aquabacterium sp. OR-4]